MMDFIRNNVKNSIVLKILMGLLMLSFGIWGVGDFLGGAGLDPSIAVKIGKTEIRTDDFQRRYTQELNRFKQSVGPQASQEEAFRRSVLNALIQELTRTATINAVGRDMDVVISPASLREEIRGEKAFADPTTGKFNQDQFVQVLAQNNLTERAFVNMFEEDIRQQKMIQPVAINATVPKLMGDALFNYRTETRVAETLLVSAANAPLAKAPTDAEIKDTYDKNVADFTAPEYRKVQAVVLNPDDLVKPDSIEDADLKAYYDQNAGRYRTPAKRHIVQLLFDTEQKAQAAKDAASPGDTLEALATKTKSGPVIDLGELEASSPLAKTIAAAFVLPEHEISPPIQSELGWHLFEVTSITPESVQAFDAVKDKVRASMAADKGIDAMYDASVQLEDQISAGGAYPDVAKTINGRLLTIEAVDRDGRDPKGQDVPGLLDRTNFLRTVFATKSGSDSDLKELPDKKGYYILKVVAVTPPAPRPLADVRPQVVAMWERAQRDAMAEDRAKKLVAQINASTDMTKVAAGDALVSYAQLAPTTRFGEGIDPAAKVDAARVSPEMLEQLFNAKVGATVSAPVAGGVVVARLKEIRPGDATGQLAVARGQMNDAVKSSIANDLMEQLSHGFAARFPVELNNTVIDDIVSKSR